jgi:hypothetical protein
MHTLFEAEMLRDLQETYEFYAMNVTAVADLLRSLL